MRRLLSRLREPECKGRRARRTGRRGERIAVRALRRSGYRILARNARTPCGEIDVLALEGRVLAIVEVKTATAGQQQPPETRLYYAQKERLRAAGRWLARHRGLRGYTVRHDLVAVTLQGIRAHVAIRRAWF